MDIRGKDTLDSLKKGIGLYKEELEIVESILALYKSFFALKDIYGEERKFIIDYGANIIEKYKKQWLDLFDTLLIFQGDVQELKLVELPTDEFYYIIHGMEKFFLKEYDLFLSSWNLEASTFIEKNSSTINLKKYMIEQSKEEIMSFNLCKIQEIIETVRAEAKLELSSKLKGFNRSISIERDDLKYFIINKASMESSFFYDELNFIREAVLSKFDELQEKIKMIIEDNLVKKTLEEINQSTEERLQVIVMKYKEALNKCYISTMDISESKSGYLFKNKMIRNEGLYRRCGAVLELELNYLQMVRSLGIEYFRVAEKEAEATLNKIFTYEFYSGIYDVKLPGDFENLIDIYKIKGVFVLENMAKGMLKEFMKRYSEIILFMLKKRKDRLQKLYIFKPITYIGNFHIYNPSVIANLQVLLNDIYDSYDLRDYKNLDVKVFKRAYAGLSGDIERNVDKFVELLDSIKIQQNTSEVIKDKKIEIYDGVTELRSELWRTINSRFIIVFNCFNDMVGRGIKRVEEELRVYENSIDYTDY